MLNKFYKVCAVVVASFLPLVSLAQGGLRKTTRIAQGISDIVAILAPTAFIVAVACFFWGVAKYIWSVGGDAKEDGKKIMVWGVVAIFVMSSIWGIVYFLRGELGVDNDSTVPIPTIGGSGGGGGSAPVGTPGGGVRSGVYGSGR